MLRCGPIISFDPGGTTGVCLYLPPWRLSKEPSVDLSEYGLTTELPLRAQFSFSHIKGDDHHEDLWQTLNLFRAHALWHPLPPTIICESFDFRKTDQGRDKIEYVSAEYIGIVKLYQRMFPDIRLVMQSAGTAKGGFWGTKHDSKIKAINLWEPGMKHAMDALRHLLYYVTFTLNDKTLLYELKRFGA